MGRFSYDDGWGFGDDAATARVSAWLSEEEMKEKLEKERRNPGWSDIRAEIHQLAWLLHAGVLDCHIREQAIFLVRKWETAFPDDARRFPNSGGPRPAFLDSYPKTHRITEEDDQ